MTDTHQNAEPTYVVEAGNTGSVSTGYSKSETDAKFKDVNFVVLTVVVILLVMVATLIIDAFHFSSITYKEYSEKVQTLDALQKANNDLQQQNSKNQQMILDQQKQIEKLLQK